jgi:hypothetical membrane protein
MTTDEVFARADQVNGALLWGGVIASPLLATCVIAAGAVTPGYSHVSDTVSQLALVDAPHPAIVRIGLMLWGVLIVGFAVGLRRTLPPGRLANATAVLLALAGAAVVTVAFVPDDENGVAATTHGLIHGVAASLAFAAVLGGMWTLSLEMRSREAPPSLVQGSMWGAGAAAAIGVLFELQIAQSVEGLLQRAFYLICAIWLYAIARWLSKMPRVSVTSVR